MKMLSRFLIAFVLTLGGSLAAQEAVSSVKITLASPLDFQVFQRSTARDGKVILAGSLDPSGKDAPIADALQVRITTGGEAGKWQPVAFDPRVAAFRAEVPAPAGGWHRIDARALKGGKPISETTVEHVGIGEIFGVAGQSNSANHGAEKLATASGLVSTRSETGWQLANDPQPGATGNGGSFIPAFGDAMAEKFGVPIGIVAVGVGATSVREWVPPGVRFTSPPTLTRHTVSIGRGAYESNGALFANLINRLKPLGRDGFRAVLWHQGESDANQREPERTLTGEAYRTLLENLIAGAQRELGSNAPWFVAQASYHNPEDPGSPDIRLAQRATWESGTALEGPDTDSLTGDFRDKDGLGVHFSGKGQREHARLWTEKVAPWLEGQLAGKPVTKSYVKLSPLFSDGTVLQRRQPVPIWGTAGPGEAVTVEFAGQAKTATADPKGAWRVTLDPLAENDEPQTLVIRGRYETRSLRDVLVGEVWLASGQSNMHWTFSPGQTVDRNEEELAAASDPLVRQFTVKKGGANAPAASVSGTWRRASRHDLLVGGTSGDSALAYFFARELKAGLRVPVGVINASVGGTPIEQWSPGGGLYNAMIHPVAPFAIRGAIWYQGESNCINGDGAKYTARQTGMVEAWRNRWETPGLPFFYVQIAPFLYSARPNSPLTPESLPEFWMAQTAALRQAHTGMAVINDITGDPGDIHPRNKQDVGKRLARKALVQVYRQTDLVDSGPMFREVKVENGKLRIAFDHAQGGLDTSDGKAPSHLEIAGADGKFVPATGAIDGETLLIHSDAVPQPAAARYGWHESAMPNLRNRAGLPAAPFHTGKWPLK